MLSNFTFPLDRCPAGWVATEEGGCTDDNECTSDPCNNGGTCINFDNGQGFLCMCPAGYMGDICHLPKQEKVILVSSDTYWIIIVFVVVNIIGKTQLLSIQLLASRALLVSPLLPSLHYHD